MKQQGGHIALILRHSPFISCSTIDTAYNTCANEVHQVIVRKLNATYCCICTQHIYTHIVTANSLSSTDDKVDWMSRHHHVQNHRAPFKTSREKRTPKPSDTAQQCKIALLAPFALHSTISKTICVKQHSQTQIIQPVLSNGAGSQKRDQTIANQMRKMWQCRDIQSTLSSS
ncbi:Hypothetical_protein [Hexamita inflata]|uniref:Hypothetical_protein n=1 Tax=Hexamita inflata TaxID=28002 RepID=A0AA86TVW8_9EUKA|nr:Hypothetical protein HINF_LOCUS11178 [Hexamita inflata]